MCNATTLNLWSNFTYFLDDPVNGDQFEQADERWIFGGSVAKTWDNAARRLDDQHRRERPRR